MSTRTAHDKVVPIEFGRIADPLRSSRPIIRIHLLGPMRATTYLGANALPRGRKARAILGCLCVARGARVARNRLAAMLWDRVPDFQGRASFRQAYRELVVSFGPLARELLVADRETVSLNINLCWSSPRPGQPQATERPNTITTNDLQALATQE